MEYDGEKTAACWKEHIKWARKWNARLNMKEWFPVVGMVLDAMIHWLIRFHMAHDYKNVEAMREAVHKNVDESFDAMLKQAQKETKQ